MKDILYFNEETKKIDIIAEARDIVEVVKLHNKDKTQGRVFYNKVLTYTYYVYSKNSVYVNMLPRERMKYVSDVHLNGYDYRKIEDDKVARAFIDRYIKLTKTITRQLFDALDKDIDELLLRIKDIPYVKRKRIKMVIDIPEYKGSDVLVPYEFSDIVEIENYKEKSAAIREADTLMEYREKLRKIVEKEEIDDDTSSHLTMVDEG